MPADNGGSHLCSTKSAVLCIVIPVIPVLNPSNALLQIPIIDIQTQFPRCQSSFTVVLYVVVVASDRAALVPIRKAFFLGQTSRLRLSLIIPATSLYKRTPPHYHVAVQIKTIRPQRVHQLPYSPRSHQAQGV